MSAAVAGGKRYRSYRKPVAHRRRHRQDILPSRCRYPHRHRASDLGLPDRAETDAARHHAASDRQLQRRHRADPAAGPVQPRRWRKRTFSISAQNFIRPALASVQGAAVTSPYGGKVRQVQIDLDPQALQADHLSAEDLENALAAQNQIIPAGTIKVGQFEYNVKLNNSPSVIDRAQQPADQAGERRDHLFPRCRPCATTARRPRPISCAWTAGAAC